MMKDLSKQIELFVKVVSSLQLTANQKKLVSELTQSIVTELNWRENYIDILKSKKANLPEYDLMLEKSIILLNVMGFDITDISTLDRDFCEFMIINKGTLKRNISAKDYILMRLMYEEYEIMFDEKPKTFDDLNKLKELEEQLTNNSK